MIKKKKKKNAFILIEVLVSVAIFVVGASALISMVFGGLNMLRRTGDYNQAVLLSQEGLEAAISLRGRGFNNFIYDTSALNYNQGWSLVGEGSIQRIEKYNRYLSFSDVYRKQSGEIVASSSGIYDPHSILVESIVEWREGSKDLSLNLKTLLTDWQSISWEQTDWSFEAENLYLNPGDYFSKDSLVFEDGALSLEETSTGTYAVYGELVSSALGPLDKGLFNSISFDASAPETCPLCNTEVYIQTSSDETSPPSAWTEWSGPNGPDGDSEDFFSGDGSERINPAHNGDEWIKYKIILRGDTSGTPQFSSINIDYQ